MLIDTITDTTNPGGNDGSQGGGNQGEETLSFLPSIESLLQPEGLFLDSAMDMFGEGDKRHHHQRQVEEPSLASNAVWNGADFCMGAPVTPMSSVITTTTTATTTTTSHHKPETNSPSLSVRSAPSPQVGKPKKRGRPRSNRSAQKAALGGSPNLYAALHKAAEIGMSGASGGSGGSGTTGSPSVASASGTASTMGNMDGLQHAGMAPQDVFSTDHQQESYAWMSELKGRRRRSSSSTVPTAVLTHQFASSLPNSNCQPLDTVIGDSALMASLGMRVSTTNAPPNTATTQEDCPLSAIAAPNMSPLRYTHTVADCSPKLPLMRQPPRDDGKDGDDEETKQEPSEFFMNELFQELLEDPPISTGSVN